MPEAINKCLVTSIQIISALSCLTEISAGAYTAYSLYSYQHLMTSSTDTVQLASVAALIANLIKFLAGAYSFDFATDHTLRTPSKRLYVQKRMWIATVVNFVFTGGLLVFLYYHTSSQVFNEDVEELIENINWTGLIQIVLSALCHFLVVRLCADDDGLAHCIDLNQHKHH